MLKIKPIQLLRGSHKDIGITGQGCFMNVIAYLNGEPQITDESPCVCVTVRPIVVWLNDYMGYAERQRLLPFIERAMGSATKDMAVMVRRARLCAEYAQRRAASAEEHTKNAKNAAAAMNWWTAEAASAAAAGWTSWAEKVEASANAGKASETALAGWTAEAAKAAAAGWTSWSENANVLEVAKVSMASVAACAVSEEAAAAAAGGWTSWAENANVLEAAKASMASVVACAVSAKAALSAWTAWTASAALSAGTTSDTALAKAKSSALEKAAIYIEKNFRRELIDDTIKLLDDMLPPATELQKEHIERAEELRSLISARHSRATTVK